MIKQFNQCVMIAVFACVSGCGDNGTDGAGGSGNGEPAQHSVTSSQAQHTAGDSAGLSHSTGSPSAAADAGGREQGVSEPTRDTAASSAPTADDDNIRILNWEETLEMVADQKGHVVVLDLWSTSCVPCIREFPNLVKLCKKYPRRVACFALNLDYTGLPDEPPESFREPVRQFLKQQGADFVNIISKTPDLELIDSINLAAVPAVYVFDQQGNLVKRFDNDRIASPESEFTYEKDIDPLVKALIAGENY